MGECRGTRTPIYGRHTEKAGKLYGICNFCGKTIRLARTTGRLYPHSEVKGR